MGPGFSHPLLLLHGQLSSLLGFLCRDPNTGGSSRAPPEGAIPPLPSPVAPDLSCLCELGNSIIPRHWCRAKAEQSEPPLSLSWAGAGLSQDSLDGAFPGGDGLKDRWWLLGQAIIPSRTEQAQTVHGRGRRTFFPSISLPALSHPAALGPWGPFPTPRAGIQGWHWESWWEPLVHPLGWREHPWIWHSMGQAGTDRRGWKRWRNPTDGLSQGIARGRSQRRGIKEAVHPLPSPGDSLTLPERCCGCGHVS